MKCIDFYQSYSPVAHADSFRINKAITDMHRLTARMLDVSNAFQNGDVYIHERSCVIPPLHYLYWFEKNHPNVTINRDDGPFYIQCMNQIQRKNLLNDNGIDSFMQW